MEGRVDGTPRSPGLALYETSTNTGSPLVSVTRFSPPHVPQTISHFPGSYRSLRSPSCKLLQLVAGTTVAVKAVCQHGKIGKKWRIIHSMQR